MLTRKYCRKCCPKMFTLGDFQLPNHIKSSKGTSTFLNYLTRKWNEIHEENDVFRYRIDNLQEKLVDGYLLQLNPDRNVKRRQPEHIDDICQPFDKNKFNFTKASPKEVICTFKNYVQDSDIHSVLVNVSPISRYHSLLCPSVNNCLPQVVTEESLDLVIKLIFNVWDRTFRVGFNSLCGFASVNHLHYHVFVENNVLPVEIAKCNHLQGPVYCLTKEYPVPAFCFEIAPGNIDMEMSKEIYKLIDYLLKHFIAHNILLTKGESVSGGDSEVLRVLIWPRKSSVGAKQLMAFNVAVLELSGWFPIFNLDDYERLQRTDLENELRKWKIDDFEHLCAQIKELYYLYFLFSRVFFLRISKLS